MFVSHAKVRIVGLGGRSRKRRPHRRRLELREMAKMPCLMPTALTVLLGLLAVAFGAGMALLGYLPTMDAVVEVSKNISAVKRQMNTARYLTLQACSYAGPVVMAIGMFAMIMACVFYCEILDKYAILVPDKSHDSGLEKDELYQV
ncbi:hypothetical protein EGW08_016281, partial [Elysia chlorotica]